LSFAISTKQQQLLQQQQHQHQQQQQEKSNGRKETVNYPLPATYIFSVSLSLRQTKREENRERNG